MTPNAWHQPVQHYPIHDPYSYSHFSTQPYSVSSGDTSTNGQLGFTSNTCSVADNGYRVSSTMPKFSAMSNSDLVDELLTPSNLEMQQERRSSSLYLASPVHRTSSRRSCLLGPISNDTASASNNRDPATNEQRTLPASKKRPRRLQQPRSVSPIELDHGYVDNDRESDDGSLAVVSKPRRSGRPKKPTIPLKRTIVPGDVNTGEDDDEIPALKQKKLKTAATAKKVSRARPGRLIRKKPVGVAVPKTLHDAGAPDRMMWTWKNQGKTWEEIRAEWKRMTGTEPGGSSLSVRYIKLNENLARNGAAGDLQLLKFRKEAEDELLSQLWPKVAEKMIAYSPESEHNPKDLQKRYNMIVRSGYDVEQLLQEDVSKEEAEVKNVDKMANDVEYEDSFDFDAPSVDAYDNDVANATAAHLRGPEAVISDDHNNNYLGASLTASTACFGSVFEPVRMLQHEVDGLNECEHAGLTKVESMSDGGQDDPLFEPTSATINPLTLRDNGQNSIGTHSSPMMSSTLVEYNSDSE